MAEVLVCPPIGSPLDHTANNRLRSHFRDNTMVTPTKGHRHATQPSLLKSSRKDASGMTEIIQFIRSPTSTSRKEYQASTHVKQTRKGKKHRIFCSSNHGVKLAMSSGGYRSIATPNGSDQSGLISRTHGCCTVWWMCGACHGTTPRYQEQCPPSWSSTGSIDRCRCETNTERIIACTYRIQED